MARSPDKFLAGDTNTVLLRLDDDNAELVRRFVLDNGYLHVTRAINDLLRDFCTPPCLENCDKITCKGVTA